jgi:hypothetical protein
MLIVIIALAVMLGVLMLAGLGCAPRATDPAGAGTDAAGTGAVDEPAADATPISWSMQSDCATCHTAEASNTDAAKHPQAAAHSASACVDCHTDETVLASTHKGVTLADKPATKVTQLTVDEQTCIACHGTLDEVAAKTAGSEALRDDQGAIVNPHQRPEGPTHAENPATCTSCHNNHSENLPKDAKKYCAQCHHRGIWQCGTCHEKRS